MIKPGPFTEERLWSDIHNSQSQPFLHELNVTECDLDAEIGLQNWQTDSGWPPRRSPSLVPLPVQLPESSPRACPRWHSRRIQPRCAPLPSDAPPELLHTSTDTIQFKSACIELFCVPKQLKKQNTHHPIRIKPSTVL